MTSAAIPYGAVELKRVAQRYWATGFILSALFHICLVGALQFRFIDTRSFQIPTGIILHPIDLVPEAHPYVPGVIEPPTVPHGATKPGKVDGTPIPVAENLVPKEQTIKTQSERVEEVTPKGREGEGEALGTKTVIDEGNSEPPPFQVVEEYPKLVSSVTPVYPDAAQLAGLEGKVLVRIWIDKEGKPRKAVVEQSAYDIFNDAACTAAMKFVFTPAYNTGGAVAVWVHIPFVFKLR